MSPFNMESILFVRTTIKLNNKYDRFGNDKCTTSVHIMQNQELETTS